MKKIVFILTTFIVGLTVIAQSPQFVKRPKLVVGIIVDQMRWDFLYRYTNRYGANGFNRLLSKGFSCENTYIPYTPAYTAAGHTCIYTGSVPQIHGIIGNNWYDRDQKKTVYCTDDSDMKTVGSDSKAGLMSPKNMWTTTITDELKLATNGRSKVIGIAIKDRGAILPAGHSANAAYWFDNASGGWISSSYYMNDLPQWVKDFNNKRIPDTYLAQGWGTLGHPDGYSYNSTEDDKPYEGNLPGEDNTFPHKTSAIAADKKYEAFRVTPFANSYTIDMAKAAIVAEQLGQKGATDFLALSFSAPDYIGHTFGPNSMETEDCYLRLDRDFADFFNYLDAKIGKGQYLLFLSADHGVAHIPGFLKERKIPAGIADDNDIKNLLNAEAEKQFGVKALVSYTINYQLFIDDSLIEKNKLDKKAVKEFFIQKLLLHPAISMAVGLNEITGSALQKTIKDRVTNGYNFKRSGDIQFIFKPQYFDGWNKGSSHGVWNPYDTHIPLLWYGWGIIPGKTNREVYMTDIAPTIAAMLKIQEPNGNVGKVIGEVVK